MSRQIGYMEAGIFHPLTEAEVSWSQEFGQSLNLMVRISRWDLDASRDPIGIIEAVLGRAKHDLVAEAMRRPPAAPRETVRQP